MTDLVEQLAAPHGALADVLPDFEVRPQQARMAEAVRATFAQGGQLLVEAGTGVGKSFAYLLPAMERIVDHGERVVISTHTIALQEQLMLRDVPRLLDIAGDAVKPVLVKGRNNYLSKHHPARRRRTDRIVHRHDRRKHAADPAAAEDEPHT